MNLCYREDSFITIIYPDYHNNPTREIARRYPHMTLQASGNPFGACWGLAGLAWVSVYPNSLTNIWKHTSEKHTVWFKKISNAFLKSEKLTLGFDT